jgi:hypothetical protein
MGRIISGLFSALLAIALLPGGAFGFTGTLDQENPAVTSNSYNTGAPWYFAQTFTAGASGNLTEVELYVFGPSSPSLAGANAAVASVTVMIFAVEGNALAGSALATSTVEVPGGNGWLTFAFTTPPAITATTMYAIAFQCVLTAAVSLGDSYAGGSAFGGRLGEAPSMGVTGDFAFRTYVAASSSTPPPTSTGTTGSGTRTGLPIVLIVGALCAVGIAGLVVRREAIGTR